MIRVLIVTCALFGLIVVNNSLRIAKDFGPANALDAVVEKSETDPKNTYASSWEVEMQKLRSIAHEPATSSSKKSDRRLAILIAGLQDRVLLASKIKNVINKVAAQGYTSDLYLSLVKSGVVGKNQTASLYPGTVESQESSDERTIRSAIAGAGNLMSYSLLTHQLDIHVPRDHPKRLTQYFDCGKPGCPLPWGTNVLRRYRALEMLFNQTLMNGPEYDFVLMTQDDDEWLGPLNMTYFESMRDSSNTLFTKDCLKWGGINDKPQLYGGKAAKKVLSKIYTGFFADSDPRITTSNGEKFLQEFATKRGAKLKSVPFGSLPTSSSVYTQQGVEPPHLCQKPRYLCNDLPSSSEFERPRLCEGEMR